HGVITTIAGNGTPIIASTPQNPLPAACNSGPATNAQLNLPIGLAVDSVENVYIADALGGCISRVSNGMITTVAGNALPGFSGDNGLATRAQLNFPAGLTIDSAGNLYIADVLNHRIRRVSNGMITT